MEDEKDVPKINFVSCVKILRQGVSKSNPLQIQLSRSELFKLSENFNKNKNPDEGETVKKPRKATDEDDEYDMEHYNDEEGIPMKVSDIAILDDDDPYKLESSDLIDSEEEDDQIKPSDSLILVGHIEGAAAILEVYVYNEEEDSLYVHHDYLLPKIPLALEWLNHDPTNSNEPGNLCAVGYVTPIIGVWDLDIVNCVEPAFKLGKKGNPAKGTARVGHKKAVLDLSWNHNFHHILASGSVDKSVILWDLDKKEPSTKISCFSESVQALKWHPDEGQTLVIGSADKLCRVFDCRTTNCYQSWEVQGEVEKVIWNIFEPAQFFACDDKGYVYSFDYRQKKKLWEISAHSQEVTGLALSSGCRGLLCTTSRDELFKVWDVQQEKPKLVDERNLKVGAIHCLDSAPDTPFLMTSGGDNRSNNLVVFNPMKKKEVKEAFENRLLEIASSSSKEIRPKDNSSTKKKKKEKRKKT